MKKNLFKLQIKTLRGNLSQADFAETIGTKQTTYSAWERGLQEPSIDMLIIIANKYNVTLDWLISGESLPTRKCENCPIINALVRIKDNQ